MIIYQIIVYYWQKSHIFKKYLIFWVLGLGSSKLKCEKQLANNFIKEYCITYMFLKPLIFEYNCINIVS